MIFSRIEQGIEEILHMSRIESFVNRNIDSEHLLRFKKEFNSFNQFHIHIFRKFFFNFRSKERSMWSIETLNEFDRDSSVSCAWGLVTPQKIFFVEFYHLSPNSRRMTWLFTGFRRISRRAEALKGQS